MCWSKRVELARAKTRRPALRTEVVPPSPIIDYAMLDGRAPTKEQVRIQAEKILQSGPLVRTNRARKLFQYIIEQTLVGNAKRLKQYSIATEALGRGSDFDPDTDPIVRLEASKLRRVLEDYYLRSGSNDPIRISIPKGSYVPTFELVDWKSVDPGLTAPARSIS